MTRDADYERFKRIDAAFRGGDLAALKAAVADPAAIPNGPMPLTIGSCLEYAIYHSPLPFIRVLLEAGADPNPSDHLGFPPLIAALSAGQPAAGAVVRTDLLDLITLLIASGADVNQRGLNDFTPLHMAVSVRNAAAVKLLIEAGADPYLRTRIDECETPRELADRLGLSDMSVLLVEAESRAIGKTR